ncbi:unnamed protein product [Rotaria sordida]|uniref:Uncharacterized protein n=1 Tax=Rotaria sordida TaxID=392033 RepID=A0A814CXP6_9BILA|nr:unnamed protein product [Rotaria sordida]CAF0990999.1 unnamed protein product [Rotaria sordida]
MAIEECNEQLPEEQNFVLLPLLMDIDIADDDDDTQLIYHAQHINDYYTLPQNIGTQTNRRISVPSANDSVSNLLRIE